MDLLARILVAVDGSSPSEAAVRLALRLAAPRHDMVSFVSVFERDELIGLYGADGLSVSSLPEALSAAETRCESALDGATAAAAIAGVDAATVLRTGIAVDSIVDEARAWNASCIVVGTHGHGGLARAFLGSVAEGVLRKSPVPVLVGHAGQPDATRPIDRILCAVDGSPASRAAFDAAVSLARAWNVELYLLSVVQVADEYASAYEVEQFDPDGSMHAIYADARFAVKALAGEASARGARVEPHTVGGSDVAERIVQSARMWNCGLVVLGTHGRGGVRRAIVGSVAEAVLRSSTIPGLVFRDPSDDAATLDPLREAAFTGTA